MALKKKNIHLAIGNVVGSVIVNIALILGIVSIASPIILDNITKIIMLSFLVVSGILIALATRRKFTKLEGTLMIAIYFTFVIITISANALL